VADREEPSRRVNARLIVVGVLALLLLVFALLNTDEVGVDFIADTVRAPLIVVVFLCALIGFLIGWFVGRRDT
jgi:uncharacterized integral membrane protein